MLDYLKKSLLTGVGLALRSKNEIEDLAKEFAQQSKMSQDDAKQFLKECQQKYEDAKKLTKITTKELLNITGSASIAAGSSSIIDPLASKIIDRAKLKTVVIEGAPGEILNAITGEHHGTVIVPE